MYYCAICGSDREVEWRNRSRMWLCAGCHRTTPVKVGYGEFCERYFGEDADVPEGTKRSFFDDYKKSECTFEQYVEQTVEPDCSECSWQAPTCKTCKHQDLLDEEVHERRFDDVDEDYESTDCLECGTSLSLAVLGKCPGCGVRVE